MPRRARDPTSASEEELLFKSPPVLRLTCKSALEEEDDDDDESDLLTSNVFFLIYADRLLLLLRVLNTLPRFPGPILIIMLLLQINDANGNPAYRTPPTKTITKSS